MQDGRQRASCLQGGRSSKSCRLGPARGRRLPSNPRPESEQTPSVYSEPCLARGFGAAGARARQRQCRGTVQPEPPAAASQAPTAGLRRRRRGREARACSCADTAESTPGTGRSASLPAVQFGPPGFLGGGQRAPANTRYLPTRTLLGERAGRQRKHWRQPSASWQGAWLVLTFSTGGKRQAGPLREERRRSGPLLPREARRLPIGLLRRPLLPIGAKAAPRAVQPAHWLSEHPAVAVLSGLRLRQKRKY